eukprot:UN30352
MVASYDGFLQQIDNKFEVSWSLYVGAKVHCIKHCESVLFISTQRSEIFVHDPSKPKLGSPIVSSHNKGHVLLIPSATQRNKFVTGGEDGQIILWDADKKFVIKKKLQIDSSNPTCISAIDWNADATLLTVADVNFNIYVIDGNSLENLCCVDLKKTVFFKR